MDREDLEQEAEIIKLECLDKYDPSYKCSFNTYFNMCLNSHFKDLYRKKCNQVEMCKLIDNTVKTSRKVMIDYSLLNDIELKIVNLIIKGYSYKEIAKILNKNEKYIDNKMYKIRYQNKISYIYC